MIYIVLFDSVVVWSNPRLITYLLTDESFFTEKA